MADTGKPAVLWCNRNDEGDLLTQMIDGARQVSGADELEEKEATFADFQSGKLRVLVIKPKIGAWGLNWQHCAHMTLFPSHSYEQYYQAVRRCWRFGQTQPVVVDVITTEGGAGIAKNLQRKSKQADAMFARLVQHMNAANRIDRSTSFTRTLELPSWL